MRQLVQKALRHGRLLWSDPARFLDNAYNTIRPAVDMARRTTSDARALRDFLSRHPELLANCRLGSDVPPSIDVLLPSLSLRSLTGGPNTAIILAYWVAQRGVPVRLVAVYDALPVDENAVWQQILAITGGVMRLPTLTLATMADPGRPLEIAAAGLLVATFWPTAHLAQSLLGAQNQVGTQALPGRGQRKEFLYLIQDFEPGFYPWSSNYAMAAASYDLDFSAIVNESLLVRFLAEQRVGRFADPAFVQDCRVFEPAVDASLFSFCERHGSVRRLLFYARPQQPRNMFALGLEALRLAAEHPAFNAAAWEFVAVGADMPDIFLGHAKVLRFLPWADYRSYAAIMREADVLLCLMLSPHTSYPVLEMAACGGLVVTNSFANKTQEALLEVSSSIIAASPSISGVLAGLVSAAQRCAGPRSAVPGGGMSGSWADALAPTADHVARRFRQAPGNAACASA